MQSGINWTCLWLDLYQRIYKAAHSLCLPLFQLQNIRVNSSSWQIFGSKQKGILAQPYFSKQFYEITFIVCRNSEPGVSVFPS